MKTLLLILFLLFSTSALAGAVKGTYPPEVAGRYADGSCWFDDPFFIDLKVEAGTHVFLGLVNIAGIWFPAPFLSMTFDEKFRGLVGVDGLFTDSFLVSNGDTWYLYGDIQPPPPHKFEYIEMADQVVGFDCPFVP